MVGEETAAVGETEGIKMKIEKRFKIYETVVNRGSKGHWSAFGEYIGSYPKFTSLEEGLKWIRIVLDPHFTGRYGIVDVSTQPA
jgi:hypothetical protein